MALTEVCTENLDSAHTAAACVHVYVNIRVCASLCRESSEACLSLIGLSTSILVFVFRLPFAAFVIWELAAFCETRVKLDGIKSLFDVGNAIPGPSADYEMLETRAT